MSDVPISFTADERTYAGLPAAVLKNRFFEQNPATIKGAAMLARPGSDDLVTYGGGPIRDNYSLQGLFDGALFTVSGDTLYRREPDGTVIQISGTIFGTGGVSMTGVAGADYQRLFIADGLLLQFYAGGTRATGTLTSTVQVTEGDTVRIGATYYRWTATVVNGSGTEVNPWSVLVGADLDESMENMLAAISFTGVQGTTYSANLGGQNGEVTATYPGIVGSEAELTVTARTDLAAGNDIATTVTGSGTNSWGAATLTGGGVHGLSGVAMPDGLPPISVATLKSYVIVAVGRSDRFYWIRPGEVTVNGLDFATAESQPDDVLEVTVVGDTAWFIGEGSTEVWYPSGNLTTPFLPVGGRVYDRGAIEGTIVNVKGTVFLVGPDYIVYAIGGSATRVSNHGVEQTIRTALESE